MVSKGTLAPCPYCRSHTVTDVFGSPGCKDCGARWAGYRAWREDCHKMGVKPGAGVKPPADEDDYIASGDMQRDVEAVVEIAILESEFDTIKRIGKEVANRTQASMERGDPAQATVDIILLYITEEVKNALRRQGKDIT